MHDDGPDKSRAEVYRAERASDVYAGINAAIAALSEWRLVRRVLPGSPTATEWRLERRDSKPPKL